MSPKDLSIRIKRAKVLLEEIHHIPLATVNSDGTPHLSPVFMVFNAELKGFWSSRADSLHSLNIDRTKNIFLTIFDSRVGHGGLFMSGRGRQATGDDEAGEGYLLLSTQKRRMYGAMPPMDLYKKSSTQKIYCFEPERFWINFSEKNKNGSILKDNRYEINKGMLI